MLERLLYQSLWQENISQKPMVFVSGPRQSGKTTFAKNLAKKFYPNQVYFNWDILENKKTLIKTPSFFESVQRVDRSVPLVIFDEIHKYKDWKKYLKGIYDQYAGDYQFLISGSGRLDLSQKGGESLAGRYLSMHLFPLTLSELAGSHKKQETFLKEPLQFFDLDTASKTREIWKDLSELGGFPEPYSKGEKNFRIKWAQTYGRQIIREDLKSVHDIRRLDDVEILFSLLPLRVGSPLSMNNLAGDLQVSFDTVKQWLRLFNHFYLTFHLSPWSKKISRTLLKEKKFYLYDYVLITDLSIRFENMVALELFRAVTQWNERGFGNFSLHYLRDKNKREVDFLIVNEGVPVLLVEAKYAEDVPAENLKYFQSLLKIPAVQLVAKENVYKIQTNEKQKVLVVTAHRWLSSLP